MDKELSGGMNGEIKYEYRPKEKEPMNFTGIDTGFAIAILVCGFLYWNLIPLGSLGAGVTIFAIILCLAIAFYFKFSGIHLTKVSIICFGIVALSALNFSLFDSIIIKGFNFIFLSISVVYWVCLYTGKRLEDKLSIYMIGDMLNQLLVVPFSNFSCCFEGIKRELAKNKHGKGLLSGLVGILIFLPVLAVVVNLLVDADAAFESLVGNLRFSFSSSMLEYVIQLVLGIPVACYLYGLVYGNRYDRHTKHVTLESVEKNAIAFRFAPKLTIYSALTALNGIYIIFFLSQAAYLFSAFGNSIPEAMTYAEYARRGFFELCTVAGINMGVIAIAHLITNRKGKEIEIQEIPKILKIETVAVCLFTMMLIATAVSKMGMYISYYGLTQLRVYTTWFMIILFIVFAIVALRQFKKFNGSKIAIISFVLFFMLLCYGNVDGLIAKYNIDRYHEGTLQTVDVAALSELSDAAIPYMYELYQQTEDEELKSNLKSVILGVYDGGIMRDPYESTFRDFNLQEYKADIIRANL